MQHLNLSVRFRGEAGNSVRPEKYDGGPCCPDGPKPTRRLARRRERIIEFPARRFAGPRRSLAAPLPAMDAGGEDPAIGRGRAGFRRCSCPAAGFKKPAAPATGRDFLRWLRQGAPRVDLSRAALE